MAVSLQSYNEILGKLARKIIADTPVNDLNPGSVLLTLLEAVAAQDFENSSSILSVLETLNIDALKNSDLDARAADYGLARKTSAKATGFIKIQDSSITKRSTTLYAVKPAPIAGATKIYVNDAAGWASTGSLFIGRGTQQFEGPISYTSVVNNGSFYTINLASALQKDHLTSDTVIDAQGTTDKLIPSGTVVKIPSNNVTPEILYVTLRDAILPAGEDTIDNIPIIAENSGIQGNAGINSITTFDVLPFATAIVSNTSVLASGRDTESDDDLRERLKNYSATLSRGTRAAILSAIIGVSDSADGKQVSSAVIQEPTTYGEPSLVYIDDGSGFQPSTAGQSVDVLLASASGGEQYLQLSNFPLPRPQISNQIPGPIELVAGSRLVVAVDEVEQEIIVYSRDYVNIASATLIEIAIAINAQANDNGYNFRCRLSEDSTRLLVYPTDFSAEFIQVSATLPSGVVNANDALKFPTNKYSYISLYKNNALLRSKETAATLVTLAAPWPSLISSGTLVISVDGTPSQTGFFSSGDFGGIPISAVTPLQWAAAINTKFAGITATATSNAKIQIRSNKTGSSSSLKIVGGTYIDDWFSGLSTYDEGTSSDFSLNRQTGNLKLTVPAVAGDSITAGNADAKGYITSTPTNIGTYDLSADSSGRPSEMVVVADGLNVEPRGEVSPAIGSGIKVTVPSAGYMRFTADTSTTFQGALVGDYIYVSYKSLTADWFGLNNTGLFKIVKKGSHTAPGTNTYVDVVNVGASAEPVSDYYDVTFEDDVQVFGSDAYPQVWRAEYVSNTVPITLQQMVSSFDNDLANVKGSIFKTNSIKATSTTENDGAIAIPVSVGKLSFIFDTKQGSELGNQSHVASRISSADMLTWFKRGAYVKRTSSNTVLLDRTRYSDVKGTISADAAYTSSTLSSALFNTSDLAYDDLVNVTSGANKSLFKNAVEIQGGNVLSIRSVTPKTSFDYLSGDSIELVKSLSFSSDDSIVFVLDGDAVNKTINVNFWRTGRVNSQIAPTNSQFSAADADNEAGITFATPTVWSTSAPTSTNFEDYAVWFRSRNWYRSGGVASTEGTLILRAKEYGPIGDTHRFSIDYPSAPLQSARIEHSNNPEYTTTTYYFGSDDARTTGIIGGSTFSVRKIETIETTAQGAGSGEVSSGDYFYLYEASNKAVVFWYAVNGSGSQPTVTISGVTVRYVKISTVVAGDTATAVAAKTAAVIDGDDSFAATAAGSIVYVTNNFNGSVPAAAQSGISFIINQDTKTCRYQFQTAVDLSTVVVGDVVSVAQSIGISAGNDGTFRVNAVDPVLQYIDVYNPYASPTAVGQVDKVSVSSITSAGVKMVQTITTTGTTGSPKVDNSHYFSIYDSTGAPVVFWYDLNGSASQPTVVGALRFVKITSVLAGDSANTVASKTAAVVNADPLFNATYASGNTFTVTNNFVGPALTATNGNSPYDPGFSFAVNTAGVADSLGGRYFKLYDSAGSVAVWLNVNGEPIPPHGCDRAIQVILSPGDSANTVASTIAAYVDADPEFTASSSTTTVLISNYYNGARDAAVDGTSPYATGFVVVVTQPGTNDAYDAPASNSGITMYPLLSTTVSEICDVVNTSDTMTAAFVGLGTKTITKATKEELLPVSYAHNPSPSSSLNEFVKMFDGESFVKTFANTNPQFVLKQSLTLQGLQPAIYDMASCPNPGTADVGEIFKLVPRTIKNVKHQLTHKALSQLPIVADVDIAGSFRRVQVKSKKLGTAGGVEIVGGRANVAELDMIGSASTELNDAATVRYLRAAVQAFPNTLSKGDAVKIYNTAPAKRHFAPDSGTKIEVYNDSFGNVSYLIGNRAINSSPYTTWSVSDVSSSYSAASGTIWRWTHTQSGAKATVRGKTPFVNFNSIVRVGGVATVTTSASHGFIAGQKIVISGVADVPAFNGEWVITATPLTNTFEFASAGSNLTSNSGGKATIVATQTTLPDTYDSSSISISSRLRAYDFVAGTTSVAYNVALTVDSLPAQGDFFLVRAPQTYSTVSPFGPVAAATYAVWFAVDGDSTAPTGTAYATSTYKIKVDILSTDTVNDVVSKLSIALAANSNFVAFMTSTVTSGTNLASVQPGDIVNVWPKAGDTYLAANWLMGNQSQATGSLAASGFPVLAVNSASRYMDVINPNGRAMSNKFTGDTGQLDVAPSIFTRFRVKHAARKAIDVVVAGGTATATLVSPHGFSVGDSVAISDTSTLDGNVTVASTASPYVFTFSTVASAGTYSGNCMLASSTATRYRISSLGFKNLFRIECTQGDSPKFADCGACVDDFVEISGSTFKADNRGRFRIRAVENDSIIIENEGGKEELNTYRLLNYTDRSATWVTGSSMVTGTAGTFSNVSVGSWIKGIDEDDSAFVQVTSMSPSTPSLATTIVLGQNYKGVSGTNQGVVTSFENDVDKGTELLSVDDLRIVECDSTVVGDRLVVDSITNSSWFSQLNSGSRSTTDWGSDPEDRRQYVTVTNVSGVSQQDVALSVSLTGFYLLEADTALYDTMRVVENTAISRFNADQRLVYMTADDRAYKMSADYGTKIMSMGKMSFPTTIATGVDGYSYYTGLMRTVQRIIDGYEPDIETYPGRRAVGSNIETLPPLIKQISMTLRVATRDGVNLNDITNDIKSTVISYISSLGVGEDVVLSEIIRRVKDITGVDAVTFTTPSPTLERIAVYDNEKALTSPDLISLS